MSFEICSHSRQLVGCQMPNFFSRIAGLSPRVATACRKLLAIVSATVSTAGPAMPVSLLLVRPGCRLEPVCVPRQRVKSTLKSLSAPCFLLFPASLPPRTLLLGAEIELLDVL